MKDTNDRKLLVSIITPAFNEESNVLECARRVAEVMATQMPEYEYEHIFSDNASTDGTLEALTALANEDHRIKVISLSRNIGPFRNSANAMRSAKGEAVIPMLAADLQDPPEVIPDLIRGWENGYYIVYGVRQDRREGFVKRNLRRVYYRTIALAGGHTAPPAHAGEFQLLDRAVVDSVLSVDDQYPYIRGLVAQTGARSTSVPYTWGKRSSGKSKNSFFDLLDQGINGFVTVARAPARLALLLGLLASLFGVAFGLVSLVWLSITRNGTDAGIPTIVVGVFVLGGLQLFFIGLIGEYMMSVHGQVRKTPAPFEVARLNFSVTQDGAAEAKDVPS